jgi:Flp pilus assembly protein protease CpaA
MQMILWSIIAFSLLFACATDLKTCEVYNVTWWISGAAAAGLWLIYGMPTWQICAELTFFCLLQCFFFSRMYGRADCYAFCVCAASCAPLGFGCFEYLVHMAFAFGALAALQLLRRNIDKRGNLKQPVAFLPYISASFALLLWTFL